VCPWRAARRLRTITVGERTSIQDAPSSTPDPVSRPSSATGACRAPRPLEGCILEDDASSGRLGRLHHAVIGSARRWVPTRWCPTSSKSTPAPSPWASRPRCRGPLQCRDDPFLRRAIRPQRARFRQASAAGLIVQPARNPIAASMAPKSPGCEWSTRAASPSGIGDGGDECTGRRVHVALAEHHEHRGSHRCASSVRTA